MDRVILKVKDLKIGFFQLKEFNYNY